MTALTLRLPEDTSLRLKRLAASRGMSLNKLGFILEQAAKSAASPANRNAPPSVQ